MKAVPLALIPGRGFTKCEPEQATHLALNMPGPQGLLTLPVQTKGTRQGTGNWTWNGSVDKPTLKPSVVTTSGCKVPNFNSSQDSCWCQYYKDNPAEQQTFHCYRCHTWVTDGVAQFLGDTTHELKGTSVALLDVPESYIKQL